MTSIKTKKSIGPPTLLVVTLFVLTFFIYADFGIQIRLGILIVSLFIFPPCVLNYINNRLVVGPTEGTHLILSCALVLNAIIPRNNIDHDLVAITISIVLSCLFVASARPLETEIEKSLQMVVIIGTIFALYVILIAAKPTLFFDYIGNYISESSREYTGKFLKEGYGVFMGATPVFILYILTLAMFTIASKIALTPGRLKMSHIGILLVLWIALLLENRKTEMLAGSFVTVYLLLSKINYSTPKKRKQIIALASFSSITLTFAVVAMVKSGFLDRYIVFIQRIYSNKGGATTDISSGRIFLWKKAWLLFRDNPIFGIGWGNFSKHVHEIGDFVSEKAFYNVHNNYLQLLCETGLVGFISIMMPFAVLYTYTKRTAIELRRLEPNNVVLRGAISVSLGFQLFFFIASLLDPIFYKNIFWWIYSIAIVFTASARRYVNLSKKGEQT